MRILVTGGSGFIGTNLLNVLLEGKHDFLSLDISEPRLSSHFKFYKKVDVLDPETLTRTIKSFAPEFVFHLAARTDLDEKKDIKGYAANIDGVRNLIKAISATSAVRRCIFTSTKLIVPNDSGPEDDQDFRPNTLYGQSKVEGEKIVRDSNELHCEWCIIRPTSIWGPWSDAPHNPYGRFFEMVAKGCYFHTGETDPPRYFGYVGNTVFQMMKLLEAKTESIQAKVFYLADYEIYHIRQWADLISFKTTGKKVRAIPMSVMKFAALAGDLLKMLGISNPPMTTFRLKNMQADTTKMSLESIRALTGSLPYSIESGVEETTRWLFRKNDEDLNGL